MDNKENELNNSTEETIDNAVENDAEEVISSENLTETENEDLIENNDITEQNEEDSEYDVTEEIDAENVNDFVTENDVNTENAEIPEQKKKSSAPVIIAIVVIAAAIIVVAYLIFGGKIGGNKYNKLGLANPSGMTITDAAKQENLSHEEFLIQYSLPEDMPEDTTIAVASYYLPVKTIADMYGIDVETLTTQMDLPTEITFPESKNFIDKLSSLFKNKDPQPVDENTPWGFVEDEMTLKQYVGEANLEDFKQFYGLGDDVTLDTKFRDVRDAINEKTIEMMAEQEAMMNEQTEQPAQDAAPSEEGQENTSETESETPAENAEVTEEKPAE